MTFLTDRLAPCILLYKNIIDFSQNIIDLSVLDKKNWIINNQDAITWKEGDKILGYDEYPINFSFHSDENIVMLGKRIFDCVLDYSVKNLTSIESFDSCLIRNYSCEPTFLELESRDTYFPSRRITSILFLSDVESGGEITFKNFEVSAFPKAGDMIILPSSFAYSFKINRPKSDRSFIVIADFV